MQNIFTSLQGIKNTISRYSGEYDTALQEYHTFDYQNIEKLKEYQNEKVKDFVKFAFDNSPFYKEFYKGIDINSINTAEDLKKLPVLEKEFVRENIEKFYTISERRSTIYEFSTVCCLYIDNFRLFSSNNNSFIFFM